MNRGLFVVMLTAACLSSVAWSQSLVVEDSAEFRSFAEKIDSRALATLPVMHRGRVAILDTAGRENLSLATGSESLNDLAPSICWLELHYNFAQYLDSPIVRVKDKKVRSLLEAILAADFRNRLADTGCLSIGMLVGEDGEADPLGDAMARLGQVPRYRRSIGAIRAQAQAIGEASRDQILLPDGASDLGRSLAAAWRKRDAQAVNSIVREISVSHQAAGTTSLWLRQLEVLYNQVHRSIVPLLLFGVCAAVGLVGLVKPARATRTTMLIAFFAGAVMLGCLFVIRWGLSQRQWYLPPIMNQYEALIASALLGAAVTGMLELKWKSTIPVVAGALYAFAVLLAVRFLDAGISAQPGILDSPIMALHVAVIIIGHALAGMAMLVSYPYLWLSAWRDGGFVRRLALVASQSACLSALAWSAAMAIRRPDLAGQCVSVCGLAYLAAVISLGLTAMTGVAGAVGRQSSLDKTNITLARLACFTITLGTILGAVWGDFAWGRWWGWDPKETWALITIILLLVGVHLRLVSSSARRGAITAVFCLLAGGAMLVNWIVVNYLLPGLHSYA